MTARVRSVEIEGFRSIGDPVSIRFPVGKPLVIVGENNAGKSNIVTALGLVLGERWPGSWAPEDHDHHAQDTTGLIRVSVEVSGVSEWGRAVDRFELSNVGGDTTINAYFDDDNPKYPKNDTRQQLSCVIVNADRRLSYQLSYTSQFTLLSKLMQRFHKALMSDVARRELLRKHFEALHEIFHGVPQFKSFVEHLQEEVSALAANMAYGLEIDFSAYDPSNYFRALRVMPKLGAERRSFDELGTGQEQILALGFAYAFAAAFAAEGSGLVLVIEEPEAHLHPLAQEWLSSQLNRFAEAGVQIVITTHSPTFLDLRNLDAVVLVRKDDTGLATSVKQLRVEDIAAFCRTHGAAKAESASILDYYDVASTPALQAGFFARGVILVEGPSDEFAVPILLRKLGVDLTRAGIDCISVGGKGNLAKWWRLFSAYDIPTYLIFDNDKSDDGDSAKRCDVLRTLGVPDADQAPFLAATSLVVEDRFAVFGGSYERTMRDLVPGYVELETTCTNTYGSLGKPFVARWVAEQLGPLDEVEPLPALAIKIADLVPRPEDTVPVSPDSEEEGDDWEPSDDEPF